MLSAANQSMRREAVLNILQVHREELRALGAWSLALFGSVARDEAGPSSDVDLLVELDPSLGLLGFAAIQLRLEALLGCRVDLVMKDALKRQLRDQILGEAIRAG